MTPSGQCLLHSEETSELGTANDQFPLRDSASYVLGKPQNYALPIPHSQFPIPNLILPHERGILSLAP